MWHEARRREKATQKLFNDHRKRCEKRREENRVDPTSFLHIYGVKSKLSLDPQVYKHASNSLVPWQGDKNITIDRFDVRATLTSLKGFDSKPSSDKKSTVVDADENDLMRKLLNYERYRLLIPNELNKVPEEVRIRLVTKSDTRSDAKMRKLLNDKFGTSGETSLPSKQSSHHSVSNNSKYSESSSKTSAMGRNSNLSSQSNFKMVPPPSSQTKSSNHLSNIISAGDDVDLDINSMKSKLIELDDYDNFELDSVDHILKNLNDDKRMNEITRKYDISSDEFSFLASNDGSDITVDQLIEELKQLKRKRDDINDDGLYGPSLPPELQSKNKAFLNKSLEPRSIEDAEDSPVRQRSPSGADIPLRTDKYQIGNPNDTSPMLDDGLYHNKTPTPHSCDISLETEAEKSGERKSRSDEPRRAVTPLAYKKYCRSDRSISRERKSSHKRHKKSSRRRSRSR